MCSILFDAYCGLALAMEGQGYFFYSLYVFKKNTAKIRILPGRRCIFTILKVCQCRNKEENSETGYRKIPYICNMANAEKNLSVETLRGIAILLVVVGHVVGSGPGGGMKIDFPHPLRYLYVWIDYIQMPLFTAIAGWAYALKPFSASSGFGSFVRKKALRLLVPMAAVGTLYFLVQYLMPGTNNKGELSQMWRIYVFPYTIYWYLPSLFLIFVVQWWMDSRKWMDTPGKWAVCCMAALILSRINDVWILHEVPDLFSFKGALGNCPILCRCGFLPFCCAALQSSGCQARHACSGAMRDCPDTDSVVLSRQMRLFEHAALSRDVDSCLVPAAGIEVAQPFFCLDRQLCVQYLSFSWFRYFRRADYTENDGD